MGKQSNTAARSLTVEATTEWPSSRLFTRVQAMAYLALSLGAFASWIQRGLIPGLAPGTRRWGRQSIDNWLWAVRLQGE